MKSESAHRLEMMIGRLLQIGVALSASIVFVGAILTLTGAGLERAQYATFRGEPKSLTTIPGVVSGAAHLDHRAVIQLGLLLLIATPFARVLFSLLAFLHERDWLYSFFTLIVLSILAYSLFPK
jgi:uncharacterized membrane protein